MKKVEGILSAFVMLAFLVLIIFPKEVGNFLADHVFAKPVAYVQMKDPSDTTKTIKIPMSEDSSKNFFVVKDSTAAGGYTFFISKKLFNEVMSK